MQHPFDSVLVLDFESLWADDYTLSKVTVEEYVRSPRFHAYGCGVKEYGTGKARWIPHKNLRAFFASIDWQRTSVMAHNAQFDVAILAWVYGHMPAFVFDTLSMSRAVHGADASNSLASLAKRFALPPKGTAVNSTKNLGTTLPADIERELAAYCCHDVDLCESIFTQMYLNAYRPAMLFPMDELRLIDMTLRMYLQPRLDLDPFLLSLNIEQEKQKLADVLLRANAQESDLASNPKFAALLKTMGVESPYKTSRTTSLPTFAFAKSDAAFQALLNGDNADVALLCEARLRVKSTLERTRAQRLLDISHRGKLPVPLDYYKARTGRYAASRQGINLQNLKRGSFLRSAIVAPVGYQLVVADLRQIEPRVLAWYAGFDSFLGLFRFGDDPYATFGRTMFGVPELTKESHPELRQSAKSAMLGCGYGIGWPTFASYILAGFQGAPPTLYDDAFLHTLGGNAEDVELFRSGMYTDETPNTVRALEIPHACTAEQLFIHCTAAKIIINRYRDAAQPIKDFWALCGRMLPSLLGDKPGREYKGLTFTHNEAGTGQIFLPNGMAIQYPAITSGPERDWTYINENHQKRIYGPKIVENCLAKGTLVLTPRGWIPIEQIKCHDLVHDGDTFVSHGGKIRKSAQLCVNIDGVWMTGDHKVLTDEGWQTARENPRPFRPNIRHADRLATVIQRRKESALVIQMPMWARSNTPWATRYSGNSPWGYPKLWLRYEALNWLRKYFSRYEQTPRVLGMALDERPMQVTDAPSLGSLWRAWNNGVCSVAKVFCVFLGRHGADVQAWAHSGAHRQQQRVYPEQLHMGYAQCASQEYQKERYIRRSRNSQALEDSENNRVLQGKTGTAFRRTFDIRNAGPQQRFVVLGETGPFIVHNCVQGVSRIVMTDAMLRIQCRYPIVLTVHDEVAVLVPDSEVQEAKQWIHAQMVVEPPYLPGIPLDAEVGVGKTYGSAK
jgi:DNA polymerase I-like protein with 3'-5' exonuclease and polymerase domains